MFAAEIVRKRAVPIDLGYQPSPTFGLTGETYLDFLRTEKEAIESGDLGTPHDLLEA
jgi:hypothetical protein